VLEAWHGYAKQKKVGVMLKNYLGSVSALATALQHQGLPVLAQLDLMPFAGWLSLSAVKQALSHYQFNTASGSLVHLPTIVRSEHHRELTQTFANKHARENAQQSLSITDNDCIIRQMLRR
jgi:hypothetical protein